MSSCNSIFRLTKAFKNMRQKFRSNSFSRINHFNLSVSITGFESNNYFTPLSGSEPGLAGYWRLQEGTGNTISDSTSHGNSLWLGSSSDAYSLVNTALPLALIGIWFNMQTSGPYLQALSSGRVTQLARVGFGTAAVNAVVSLALVVPLGLSGVLIGTCLANVFNLSCYAPWRSRGLHAQSAVLIISVLGTLLWGAYTSFAGLFGLFALLLLFGLITSIAAQEVLREWFVAKLRLALR